LMQRFPGLTMCWIFPGTSMDLNLAGRSEARWGMCRSPRASTSTMLIRIGGWRRIDQLPEGSFPRALSAGERHRPGMHRRALFLCYKNHHFSVFLSRLLKTQHFESFWLLCRSNWSNLLVALYRSIDRIDPIFWWLCIDRSIE
jgi:hypothetical protein